MRGDDYKKQLTKIKKEAMEYKNNITQAEEFKATVSEAVAAFQKKKYAPLYKAYQEYGERWVDIENAYGYAVISRSKYDKLETLKRKSENDKTGVLMGEVMSMLNRHIDELNNHLKKLEEQQKYYETEIKEIENVD